MGVDRLDGDTEPGGDLPVSKSLTPERHGHGLLLRESGPPGWVERRGRLGRGCLRIGHGGALVVRGDGLPASVAPEQRHAFVAHGDAEVPRREGVRRVRSREEPEKHAVHGVFGDHLVAGDAPGILDQSRPVSPVGGFQIVSPGIERGVIGHHPRFSCSIATCTETALEPPGVASLGERHLPCPIPVRVVPVGERRP